ARRNTRWNSGFRSGQAASSKFQAPNSKEAPGPKHQTPNTKHQTPNTKHQTPSAKLQRSSKLEAQAAVWSLELGISLVFGAWFLVFRFRIFPGAWGLVLGVSLLAELPRDHDGRIRISSTTALGGRLIASSAQADTSSDCNILARASA